MKLLTNGQISEGNTAMTAVGTGIARRARTMLVAALAVCGVLSFAASSAVALELEDVGGSFTDPATGTANFQAGAHPDIKVKFSLSTRVTGSGRLVPDGSLKTVTTTLPPGIVGNPTAIATCPREELVGPFGATCAVESQIGIAQVMLEPGAGYEPVPVYNLQRSSDSPGEFGFNIYNQIVTLAAGVRPGDYAIEVLSANTSQAKGVGAIEVTMWGVPADSAHDPLRFDPTAWGGFGEWGTSTSAQPVPFLTSSTACSGVSLTTTLSANSWQAPTVFSTGSFSTDLDDNPIVLEGCERLNFSPSLEVRTTSQAASTPSGLAVDIRVPQTNRPRSLGTAHVKDVTMTLPLGMSVSPASAAGLEGCTPAQIGLATEAKASCPPSSKLGTVAITTPLLEQPMQGNIMLAQPYQNPFGSLLALYIVAEGSGVTVKVPGKVEADPKTGQLTITFANNPQLPFSELSVRMSGGPNASLVTPPTCGQHSVVTQVTSWSGKSATLTAPLSVDTGCQRPGFAPEFFAGVDNPAAGADSSFGLGLARGDGSPQIRTLEKIQLPKGLLARVGSVPLCGEAEANLGTCPAGSRIGDVQVSAGAGTQPLWVPQIGRTPTSVSLTGPYRGAPYGLSIAVPAQAGPFDLGRVVVRSALHVDERTTQLTTGVDEARVYGGSGNLVEAIPGAMPTILEGIPLDLREIRVNVDRPNFVVNPTNCVAQTIALDAFSVAGERASLSSRFQVGDCASLAFKPKLQMRFFGKTSRSSHPRLKATLTAAPGEANIGKATVLMPKTELLENAHIRTICTRDQWAADSCPKGAIYGYAKAWTPLLGQPLEGPVYLRANGGARQLPDLVADLKGQIDVELVGYIDAVNARLRARFLEVPDAPVSKFVLDMQGGKKSLLVHNTNVCKTKPRASVKFDGQNGKVHDFNPVVKTSCGKGKKK